MINKVTHDNIRGRQEATLVNHYLSLEVTVISVALAVAGLAAASLLTRAGNPGSHLALFWLLWVGGLLATAVGYAGPMIGAFALPPSIPTIGDLLPPLGLGIIEFLMFSVLINQVTAPAQLDTILETWLWLVAIFGIMALIAISRARYLFREALSKGIYAADVRNTVRDYVADLSNGVWGPIPLISSALTGAILWSVGFREIWLAFLLAILIIGLLLGALWFQGRTAKMWRERLDKSQKNRRRRIARRINI
jgi:hypothetical protein